MDVRALVVGPFEENCWLLHDPARGEVVLVDPGDEPTRLCTEIERLGARLVAVWLTHAHLDHIGGIAGVRRAWPEVPVHLHPLDLPVYAWGEKSARVYGIPFEQPAPPDRTLTEGQRLEFGGESFEVIHLPGHAPGHVAFVGRTLCFSGDVLFAGSIGRTDLPGADPDAMEASLARMAGLSPALIVHPGHGPDTTIGDELAANPFLTGAARVARRRG
ncbi:MAG: MBL fold metallo-hydrolase [Gemmatimonadetes bacterium]|nr:MBL fold metallo-hydrolase [Gemmatimonadota bacterium]